MVLFSRFMYSEMSRPTFLGGAYLPELIYGFFCGKNHKIVYSRHRPKKFTPVVVFSLPSNSMTPMMIGAMVTIHSQCGFR